MIVDARYGIVHRTGINTYSSVDYPTRYDADEAPISTRGNPDLPRISDR